MKLCLVTDTHFGVRSDNEKILDHQLNFFRDVFFPTIKERKIDTIIHLGDVFDRRKYINFLTLKRVRDVFIRGCNELDMNLHFICGNHDSYYKNTNDVNSLNLLLAGYEKFTVYDHVSSEVEFDGMKCLFIPWITRDNRTRIYDHIKSSNARIVMGHLEISGFDMIPGVKSDAHLKKSAFDKFDKVFSGHFHIKSKQGNIRYLGTPYQMTWMDYNQDKGFYIFDTKNGRLEYIKNENAIFEKIVYNDKNLNIAEVDYAYLKDKYVKVLVEERNNVYLFDQFIKKIEYAEPIDITILEDYNMLNEIDPDHFIDETKDTLTLLHEYIDSLESNHDKFMMKKIINEIYEEAHMA